VEQRQQMDWRIVMPGGRNFSQKAQKGPGKIKLTGRICGQILLKVAEKGPKKIVYRNSLFNDLDTLSETKNNFNLILDWSFMWMLHWRYCEIGWIFFYVRARKQFLDLATLQWRMKKKEYHLGEGNKEVSRIHLKSFTTSMCDRNLDDNNFENRLISKVLGGPHVSPTHTKDMIGLGFLLFTLNTFTVYMSPIYSLPKLWNDMDDTCIQQCKTTFSISIKDKLLMTQLFYSKKVDSSNRIEGSNEHCLSCHYTYWPT
jgi:hypothetical protein